MNNIINNHNQGQIIARILTFALLFELCAFPHASTAMRDTTCDTSLFMTMCESKNSYASVSSEETRRSFQALPTAEDLIPARTRRVLVTAYSSTPDQTDDSPFITANGTRVRDGIIAANFLHFGTQVKIPELYGDKVFFVTDRMHERFSDRVDIWMASREEANTFGVKIALIEIY